MDFECDDVGLAPGDAVSRPVFFNPSDLRQGYAGYQAVVSHKPAKKDGNTCSTIHVKAKNMVQAIDRTKREARNMKLKKFQVEQLTRFMPI